MLYNNTWFDIAVLNSVCVCGYVYYISLYSICFDVLVLCVVSMSTSFAFMRCTMKNIDTFHLDLSRSTCVFVSVFFIVLAASLMFSDACNSDSSLRPCRHCHCAFPRQSLQPLPISVLQTWLEICITGWKQLLRRMLSKTVRTACFRSWQPWMPGLLDHLQSIQSHCLQELQVHHWPPGFSKLRILRLPSQD